MANTISNLDDVIDSRDVIERIEELQNERDDLELLLEEEETYLYGCEACKEWDEENGDELRALLALQEEAEGYCPDWTYGAQLIRDSYFVEYAQELAEDCGDFDNAARWPYNCIDWERAARELQYDYAAVDFDGVTYWVR